jgi:putative aldouronate transport system permease protein
MIKRSRGENIFAVFNYIMLTLLAITTLYPFIYILTMSLSTTLEAIKPGFHLYPKEISLTSYQMVFKNKEIIVGYGNTIFRTVAGVVTTLIVTSMFAYPLSKDYMPNRKLFTFITLFTMLFSGGLIPTYLLMRNLHLINNRLVFILPGLVGAYNVIVLKSFFKSIPESLPESAKIDGANEFVVLFRIILPLSKPVLATLALWTAVSHWNAWFDAMIYINSYSKQVLQFFLQKILIENNQDLIQQGLVDPDRMTFTPETIKAATIVITILPILFVYPFVQKYFVKGIMLGSVKG